MKKPKMHSLKVQLSKPFNPMKRNLLKSIAKIREETLPLVTDPTVHQRLDDELQDLINQIVGIDPDDEEDSVPPLEASFYDITL